MFTIELDDTNLRAALDRLIQTGTDMSPVMRMISTELADQTEANLAAEGRPKWLPLAPSTIKRREKAGSWPGMIMQVSGQLAASYTPGHDAVSAWLGSNKAQAAIQNRGGETGRNHAATIPPRPSLPIDEMGNLQPEAGDAILGLLGEYFSGAIEG